MLPWGHAAVGYLVYTAVRLGRDRTVPTDWGPIAALAVGTQFPDLIDKPLAWEVALLPTGRSLGHTLLVLVPAVAALWAFLPSRRRLVGAFSVGWVTHLLADARHPLMAGTLEGAGYLFWPLTALPPYDPSGRSILAFFLELRFTPEVRFQLGLTALAAAVWLVGRYRSATGSPRSADS